MPITIYPGIVKKRNSNGTYSDLVPGADVNSQLAADIATQYDSESTYEVGDYCLYEGDLYVCNTQISTPEEWSYSHWTGTNLGDEISEQKTALNQLYDDKAEKTDFTNIFQTGTTCTVSGGIAKGTYFYLNDVLVRAKVAIAENASFIYGTNYDAITVGQELAALNSFLSQKSGLTKTAASGVVVTGLGFSVLGNSIISSGYFNVQSAKSSGSTIMTVNKTIGERQQFICVDVNNHLSYTIYYNTDGTITATEGLPVGYYRFASPIILV